MQKSKQISDSLRLAVILTLSGGFMDAYSFVNRGGVFANAQTGNIVLLAVHFATGQWSLGLKFLFPVIFFTFGIILSDMIRHSFYKHKIFHWRQYTVLLEAVIFFIVAFLPQDMNALANGLISFACGLQVESFRKIKGLLGATTMCIGNLRTATQSMVDYFYTKEKSHGKKALLFYSVIIIFALGAVIGDLAVKIWSEKAILVCCAVMFFSFLMMFRQPEE